MSLDDLPFWNRSSHGQQRLNHEVNNGTYQGRPIIKRDSRINGGVSLGASPREAIVVDFQYGELDRQYQPLAQAVQRNPCAHESTILLAVYRVIDRVFIKRADKDLDFLIKKLDVKDDEKTKLDHFIRNGTGVCRHMALTAGALIERLIDEGYLTGKISVDRNDIPAGAHAWARYTSQKGEVIIIDPSLKFFGKLNDPKACWPYARPEDK
ncbi:hypothetical protein C4573_02435 [Candidatus Woesearchaeota archaeon]|nr:MAG: hypothetical protein C4573_02435 [Candidatus Woesearchaeota archaeon]